MHWQLFGSNGQEKADYSRGVLERFTRRAKKDLGVPSTKEQIPTGNCYVKSISNPRMIRFIENAHAADYYENCWALNENGDISISSIPIPLVADKIVINHYHTKSREEYAERIARGKADQKKTGKYSETSFQSHDHNEVFDDGILHYRAERAKTFRLPDKSHAIERIFSALTANLSPTLLPNTPPQFYAGKLETFLTCRAVAAYLKTKLTDDASAKFFEEAAIKAINRTLEGNNLSVADVRLLLSELPDLLCLPYSSVKEIHLFCLNIIPRLMDIIRLNSDSNNFNRYISWKNYVELDYLQRLLQTWKPQ